jgi:hypothetical protein
LDRGIDLFVGMEEELKEKLPTADERQEYAELEAAGAERALPGGGRDALEAARQRRTRLGELKDKMAYQPVTLTEVGEDYIAFESGEGLVTYLPAHRLGSLTKRAGKPASPKPPAE